MHDHYLIINWQNNRENKHLILEKNKQQLFLKRYHVNPIVVTNVFIMFREIKKTNS